MEIKAKKIEIVPIESVRFYEKNRNNHSTEQIERLVKLLEYQGMRVPLIVDVETNQVIAGNGRLEAMQKMKWKEVPVIYQKFDSDEQRYAFSVSDNAVSSWAQLDFSGINLDLGDLGPDFDIELLGIKDFQIDVADKIKEVNAGNENSEWVSMPEFKEGNGYIKLTYIFASESDREKFVEENKIQVNTKRTKESWIVYP